MGRKLWQSRKHLKKNINNLRHPESLDTYTQIQSLTVNAHLKIVEGLLRERKKSNFKNLTI